MPILINNIFFLLFKKVIKSFIIKQLMYYLSFINIYEYGVQNRC